MQVFHVVDGPNSGIVPLQNEGPNVPLLISEYAIERRRPADSLIAKVAFA